MMGWLAVLLFGDTEQMVNSGGSALGALSIAVDQAPDPIKEECGFYPLVSPILPQPEWVIHCIFFN